MPDFEEAHAQSRTPSCRSPAWPPLLSAHLHHALNLSKWGVNKHLVNHFHVCKELMEVNAFTSFYFLLLCFEPTNNRETSAAPAVNPVCLKSPFGTLTLKPENLTLRVSSQRPIHPAGVQGRNLPNTLTTADHTAALNQWREAGDTPPHLPRPSLHVTALNPTWPSLHVSHLITAPLPPPITYFA